MIICTQWVPRGFSACCLWPFILARPGYRHDAGLIEHELVHYREQAWITPVWVLLYLASRRFRLAAELRAYARQVALGGVTREQAAQALLSYRTGITLDQALQAVQALAVSGHTARPA